MDWTSELGIAVRRMVLQGRRDAAVKLLEAEGFEDPEAEVLAVEERIEVERARDRERYVDYARRRGLTDVA